MPFGWVAGDTIYGVGELEMALRRAGKGYVLGASATDVFNSWGKKPPVAGAAEAIAAGLEEGAWQRLSAGDGTKGERLYDWAYCELADLDAAEYNEALSRPVDTRTSDPPQLGRWRACLLLDLVPGRDRDRDAGGG